MILFGGSTRYVWCTRRHLLSVTQSGMLRFRASRAQQSKAKSTGMGPPPPRPPHSRNKTTVLLLWVPPQAPRSYLQVNTDSAKAHIFHGRGKLRHACQELQETPTTAIIQNSSSTPNQTDAAPKKPQSHHRSFDDRDEAELLYQHPVARRRGKQNLWYMLICSGPKNPSRDKTGLPTPSRSAPRKKNLVVHINMTHSHTLHAP